MNTHAMCFSWFVRAVTMGALLCIAVMYASSANAAQGCGQGFHRGAYGGCVMNHPGPNATAAPAHPGCWRNGAGQLRCPR